MQHDIPDQPPISGTPVSSTIPIPRSEESIAQPLSTAQLQKRIIWYAGLGGGLISLIVAIVSLFPFYQHLREDVSATLVLNVGTRTLAIEEHLIRASDIAAQITSRSRLREELVAYNQGNLSRSELVALSEPKLADALSQSEDIVGLLRFDQQGQPVIQLGLEIPQATWSFISAQGTIDTIALSDPVWINETPYLVVAAPIQDVTETVGTDIVMFDLSHLQKLVLDTTDMGDSSTTVLGSIRNNQLQVFFDSSQADGFSAQPAEEIAALALQHADQHQRGLLDAQEGGSWMVSYQMLEKTPWIFMVVADKGALYSPVYQQMGLLLAVVISMLVLGTLGMTWLLRPLTGHVVMRAGTLEQEVAHKTASLQLEIQERERAEQELRIFRAMAENAPDMIGFARLDNPQMTYANPAYHQLLGYDHQSIVGMHLTDVFAEAPDSLRALVENGVEQSSWSGVISYRRADGSTLPAFLTGFIVRDEAENAIAIAGIARDISEQLRVEAERDALHQQVVDAQRTAIRELSTPLIPITDTTVVMPLIGTIDSSRAQQIMETLLAGVAQQRATIAILDITGVQVIDTQVANALVRVAQAVKLLGAQVVLTGIRPEVAQMLVHLGAELSGVITHSTLQVGIDYAITTVDDN